MRIIDLEKKTSFGGNILLFSAVGLFLISSSFFGLVFVVSYSVHSEVLGLSIEASDKDITYASNANFSLASVSNQSTMLSTKDDIDDSLIKVYTIEELSKLNQINIKIDRYHGLPKEYIPRDLVLIDSSLGNARLINDASINLTKLNQEVMKKGWKLKVNSGYRSFEDQENLYNNILKTNLSISKDELVAKSQTEDLASKPGFSEHQLGTAVDIGCANCKSEEDVVNMYRYLAEVSEKFGFKLSYPENNIHSFRYEPWHFRYWQLSE